MSGVSINVIATGLQEALNLIDHVATAPRYELMDGIGRLVQEQTRERIEVEKTSPDGAAWKANWAGSNLLYKSGALAQSIDYIASNDNVVVGSGIIYARIHQEGGKIVPKHASALAFQLGNQFLQVKSVTMPARPYIGLSAANEQDVLDATTDWVRRLLQ